MRLPTTAGLLIALPVDWIFDPWDEIIATWSVARPSAASAQELSSDFPTAALPARCRRSRSTLPRRQSIGAHHISSLPTRDAY